MSGNRLSTWCALDPLFIVPAIGQAAVIESADPKTQDPVKVSIAEDGSVQVKPPQALLSLVIPQGSLHSVEDVWMQFCQHVHFFVSAESAEGFLSEREGKFKIVSVTDGFEIGRRLFAEIYQ